MLAGSRGLDWLMCLFLYNTSILGLLERIVENHELFRPYVFFIDLRNTFLFGLHLTVGEASYFVSSV